MKLFRFVFAAILSMTVLSACGADNEARVDEDGNIVIDELSVVFVPSRDPDEITVATAPLAGLLKDELLNHGYHVENVDITVGTNYETVGESLATGSAHIGFVPGGTFVLYDDAMDVILTSTRAGLNKDYENPADWNDGLPTTGTDEQVANYRSLILAGPSEVGRELAEIVNNGGELTWDDLDGARWAVMSTSSSAGYIYPTIWLRERFDGRGITDLSQVVQSDSYTSSFARLAAEQIDVMVVFADGRRDNEESWTGDFGRDESIWEEVNVIGVTPPIFNDTISVTNNSPIMTDELKAALQESFINIAQTDEGREVISIYNHEGYKAATSSDYDVEREAQDLMRELDE